MTTHSPTGSAAESLEAALSTLKATARNSGVDAEPFLAAYSLAFESAWIALLKEANRHHPNDPGTPSGLFRLAQHHGLIESQSRWETYLKLRNIIERRKYPDCATMVSRYVPAFIADAEALRLRLAQNGTVPVHSV